MRRTRVKLAIAVAVLGMVVTTTAAVAGGGGKTSARLSGFEEVPAVLTDGSGKLKVRLNRSQPSIDYELRYADLEGGNVLFAHIHIGQRLANGAVAAFLCGGGGKPACPPSPATVTGTITPANVVPVPAQGVRNFDDLVEAMRKGITYANVHTTDSPAGEIRGQIGDKNGHKPHNGHNGHNGGDDD